MDTFLQETQIPRSVLRDLVAVSSLPEIWIHRKPSEIANGLAEILVHTLYLDIVYTSLDLETENRIEAVSTRGGKISKEKACEIGRDLQETLLRLDSQDQAVSIGNPIGNGVLQAVLVPIHIGSIQGCLVAASRESGFPTESNWLLLRATINQATVILGQKQLEEQLRRKQEELSDFFENASEGLHWVGPDGVILWANQAELDMLGYTREEYIGHRFDEFHAEAVVAENILSRLIYDQPVHNYEARLRCKDGSIKHVLINSTVYRQKGKFIHTRCFTRDITERKQMEQMLRKAYDDIEMQVQFRTRELSAAIEALKEEIAIRQRVEAEVAELRGRLSESRESERLLLAQELHDGPIQDLFALSYNLTALLNSDTRTPQLQSMQDGIMQVIGALRKLCEELRPSTLITFGLEKAIQFHLEQFQKQNPAYRVQMELEQDGRLQERSSLALFRIYQQALANIVRHAQADQIVIRFRVQEDHAFLEVQDNGRGFTVPTNWLDFARQGHFGLIGGFERAEAVGGKLTINSAPGKGTCIQVAVPIETRDR